MDMDACDGSDSCCGSNLGRSSDPTWESSEYVPARSPDVPATSKQKGYSCRARVGFLIKQQQLWNTSR